MPTYDAGKRASGGGRGDVRMRPCEWKCTVISEDFHVLDVSHVWLCDRLTETLEPNYKSQQHDLFGTGVLQRIASRLSRKPKTGSGAEKDLDQHCSTKWNNYRTDCHETWWNMHIHEVSDPLTSHLAPTFFTRSTLMTRKPGRHRKTQIMKKQWSNDSTQHINITQFWLNIGINELEVTDVTLKRRLETKLGVFKGDMLTCWLQPR